MSLRVMHEIAGTLPIGVLVGDAATSSRPVLYVNPAFEEQAAVDPLEVIAGRTGAPALYVETQRRADGAMGDEQYHALRDILTGMITARQDEMLEARERTIDATLVVGASVPLRIIALAADGTVLYANDAVLRLLEQTATAVTGTPITQVLERSDIDQWCNPQTPPGEHRFEITWPSPSGVRRELGITMVRLGQSGPGEAHDVLVFRDMGDHRHHTLEAHRIKGMNELGQMAAGFAHEVRNPLAALRSLAEALRGELASDDPRQDYPLRMLHLVQRMDLLVKNALRFGRPKAPSPTPCSAALILAEAVEALQPRLVGGNIMVIEMDVELPDVRVDEEQTVEVLVNLLENALDSVTDPARVHIRVAPNIDTAFADAFIRFDVSDDGAGINNRSLSRIFDPFFTTKPKGTGLGLAIAQRLARENGGHLLVASVPGVKTTFSLLLPSV